MADRGFAVMAWGWVGGMMALYLWQFRDIAAALASRVLGW